MKYMGSKARIAKYILPIMLKDRKPEQWWVEPFVGGGNMIDNVENPRLGADFDKLTIDALNRIKEFKNIPKNNKEFTETDYKNAKDGYSAYALSYGGKKWGGWRRDSANKRDYVAEAYRNALKQSKNLKGVLFDCVPYDELSFPANSLIYCDPPYKGTTKYKEAFNHDKFWAWCRSCVEEGHTVFVSEYQAPDDWVCMWEKEICSSLTKNTGSKKGVERLFKHKSQVRRIYE